ncbi:NUDIX domain-containing protein [Actinopolymorpha alba]|uniref:NUDIX domain-containing protein n=1 Tax=Actinopolymorpha alba TaxID=533267 RepID=UPI0003707A6E|nr:NUDIX domain-containing protein [Actinopolymorpha alba]
MRELAEETGLTGRVDRLLGVHAGLYTINGVSIHGVRLLYLVDVIAGSLRREQDGGTDDAGWFGPEALEALSLSAHAHHALALLDH